MKTKTARSRKSFVEVSQGRGGANEPSSFLFLPLPPPRRLLSLVHLPLPFVLLLPTCTFALPLILFVLFAGTEKPFEPSCSSFLSDHTVAFLLLSHHSVLLLLSASGSFLLLVSSSCSHDSLYEVASSACNYCRYILSASLSVNFCFSCILLFYRLSYDFFISKLSKMFLKFL